MLQIAGVWHTAVVVRGMEYFYGGGVQVALAGSTPYGHPVDTVDLGYANGRFHSAQCACAHPRLSACMHHPYLQGDACAAGGAGGLHHRAAPGMGCAALHGSDALCGLLLTRKNYCLWQVFTPQAYNLFHNNCNNFSNEVSTFLTGQAIPVSAC